MIPPLGIKEGNFTRAKYLAAKYLAKYLESF
jgi:hypothetical protein